MAEGRKVLLDDLLEGKKKVYVVNTSDPKGDITILTANASNQPIQLVVPKTWIPICLNEQASPDTIARSDDLRKLLNKGMLALMDPEIAEEKLNDPDAQDELARLNTSKYAGVASAMGRDSMGRDSSFKMQNIAEVMKKLDKNVNVLVLDVLARDIPASEKFQILKGTEETLKKEDFEYIVANGDGKLKDWGLKKLEAMRR